ncbi:MAG: DUF5694 domain-containing protein [Saprospiraceae bacterium]|nr:DUF5694 domain-containing protein [Saprospiraceae bacterium]
MRFTLGHLLAAMLVITGFHPGMTQDPVQVTILGTHHFHNPGADMFNIHQDDVKAPKRQAEIRGLVERLLPFNPTKVVIEKPYGDSLYPQRYEHYLEHRTDDSLSRNEIEQVGFRIAAHLGHPTVYPFDFRQGMDMSELMELTARDPEVGARFQALFDEMGAFIAGENERLASSTMTEFLRYMNKNEVIELNHESYLRLLHLTGEDSYGASKAVADWYTRNIYMFYNLNRIADFTSTDERLLIIVGQGHVKILRDLIEDAPYYEYVDVMEYLTRD